MADPSFFDPIRIPTETLVALDWRPYHFAMQRYHYLLRTAHILSMALFFGGIAMLDFRLVGWRDTVPLKPFAEHVLRWLYGTFVVSAATGVALFLYDPVHAGSRAYWTPKLVAIALGLANAAWFHRTSYLAALATEGRPPMSARIAGALSLTFWTATLVFACLNTEAMPKVILR
jgi:succinate-acetate transporter protein